MRFQSTLPARGATVIATAFAFAPNISIHAPRTGSDVQSWYWQLRRRNFNPRSPHGERQGGKQIFLAKTLFQSTLPARGATGRGAPKPNSLMSFQSTLPARGATRRGLVGTNPGRFQSTLPARGATFHQQDFHVRVSISIHAPRTGSDRLCAPGDNRACDFNPRSPHGERRCHTLLHIQMGKDFNPRSPHGERLVDCFILVNKIVISIHAPRTGSDNRPACEICCAARFQSTLPARGAT